MANIKPILPGRKTGRGIPCPHVPSQILCYICPMVITQTVEIPDSRRIFLDLPHDLPMGKAKVELNVIPEAAPLGKTARPLEPLLGIHEGLDTMDAYFARKQAEKVREFEADQFRRNAT